MFGISKVTMALLAIVLAVFGFFFFKTWQDYQRIDPTVQSNSQMMILNDFMDQVHQSVVDSKYVHVADADKEGLVTRGDFGLGDAIATRTSENYEFVFKSLPTVFGQQKFFLNCSAPPGTNWSDLCGPLCDEAARVFSLIDRPTIDSVVSTAAATVPANMSGDPETWGSESNVVQLAPIISWHKIEVACRAGQTAPDQGEVNDSDTESKSQTLKPHLAFFVTISKL